MTTRRAGLAPWTYPILLAATGLILFVARWPAPIRAAVAGTVAAYVVYLAAARRRPRMRPVVSELTALLPGHLMLLFAAWYVAPQELRLVYLWLAVPVATMAYDATFRWAIPRVLGASISSGLYAIIWADLAILLERILARGRGLGGRSEFVMAAVLAVVWTVFVGIGVYRHWRAPGAVKE